MSEKLPQEKGMMAKLGEAQAAPPWGFGEVGLVLAVLLIGMLMIGTGVTTTVASDSFNPEPLTFIVGWMVGLIVVAIFILIRWRRTQEKFVALAVTHDGKWQPLLAVLVGIGGAFTAAVIAGLGSGDFISPIQVIGVNEDIGSILLIAVFVMLIQPIAEGLVFWAIALPRLRHSLSPWAGLLTSMVLFALYYYMVFGSRVSGGIALWYGAIYPLIIGFTLAAVRVWSGSSRAAILAQVGIGISILLTMIVL